MNVDRLPSHARPRAAEFVGGLRSLAIDGILGLYVHGSVGMDDYQPGRSDLDVVIVTETELSAANATRIAALHTRTPRPRLNGAYVPRAVLSGEARVPMRIVEFDGHRVWHAKRSSVSPVLREDLAGGGCVALGPDLRGMLSRPSVEELREWVCWNMNDYWRIWAERSALHPVDALALVVLPRLTAWGVLGVSRQLFTLREGGIVSKTRAGEYALEHVAPEHHRVLREALRIRRGETGSEYPHPLSRRSATLRFVRDIIAEYGRDPHSPTSD